MPHHKSYDSVGDVLAWDLGNRNTSKEKGSQSQNQFDFFLFCLRIYCVCLGFGFSIQAAHVLSALPEPVALLKSTKELVNRAGSRLTAGRDESSSLSRSQ